MGRKRKKPKVKKLEDDDILGIKFEIEDDAEEVFAAYLDRITKTPPGEWDKDELGNEEATPSLPVSKQPIQSTHVELDLHGLHLADAIYQVDKRVRELLAQGPRIVHLKIITGKGLHSGPQGSVLAREVHDHVSQHFRKNIVRIDESPAAVALNGVPIRGHFTVVLKRTGA